MTTVRETCILKYETSEGGNRNVRINDPRPGLTEAQVRPAGNRLTTIEMFDSEIGLLTRLAGADIQRVTTTVLI